MSQFSADDRLLLGTCHWAHPAWLQTYYPDDLPEDWRLSYYANDCDCLLLPAEDWCGAGRAQLLTALEDAPQDLVWFLEIPSDVAALATPLTQLLAPFDGLNLVALVGEPLAELARLPQWQADGRDRWTDPQNGYQLQRWRLASADLRTLRAHAEQLTGNARAIVIDGGDSSPDIVPEMRTMLGLMGRL